MSVVWFFRQNTKASPNYGMKRFGKYRGLSVDYRGLEYFFVLSIPSQITLLIEVIS